MYRRHYYNPHAAEISRKKTCFMAPIPEHTSNDEILEFFSDYSPIHSKIIDKGDGNRFAFIKFSTINNCELAYNNKNKTTFKNVVVTVNCSYNEFESGERLGTFQRHNRNYFDYYDDFY